MSTTPASWYPDPTQRHQMRYWDGANWTAHVSDNGVTGDDPMPGAAPKLDRFDAAMTVGNEGDPSKIQQQVSGDGSIRSANIGQVAFEGTGSIFDEPILVVNQKAKLIELNGASAGAAVDGLKINTSNCIISALVINRFLGDQIEITNGANNVVEGCYLGLGLTGLTDASTGLNGILLTNSPGNTIGGLDATNRNYISGNL